MTARRFAAADGRVIELDLCFACQGLWFDPHENSRLAPEAVIELFELLHAHRGEGHRPLATQLGCARCAKPLARGFDVAQGGRYVTWRCAARHGRFSTFGSFMVEKGFVRHLTAQEVQALAAKVGTVRCTACGGPVNLRERDTCPWCQSALSLLDPQAVSAALQRHEQSAQARAQARTPEALADALMALERQNAREDRENLRQRLEQGGDQFDLVSTGVEIIWGLFRR